MKKDTLVIMSQKLFNDKRRIEFMELYKLKYPTVANVIWEEHDEICINGDFKGQSQTMVLSKEKFSNLYVLA